MCNSGAPFDKESALLFPVKEEFSRRHSEAFPLDEDGVEVNPDDLHPRSAVIMRGLRGLLTGLTDKGCLQIGRTHVNAAGLEINEDAECLCLDCFQALKKKELPKRALMAGTWQGLIPPELKNLDRVSLSMICFFNAITIIGRLPSGIYKFL
jgi:hypothetical protein